jgi:hypothetical protein
MSALEPETSSLASWGILCWSAMLAAGCRPPAPSAAEAKQAVLEALSAEESAGPRRLHIDLQSNGRTLQQTLEIVPPDRAHVVIRLNGQTEETFYVGDTVYAQVDGMWHAIGKPEAPFDGLAYTSEFFRAALVAVRSPTATTRSGRAIAIYGAEMRWTLHGKAASGTGDVAIDRDTGRPVSITFEGTCAGAACKFEETFEYDPSITVQAPL